MMRLHFPLAALIVIVLASSGASAAFLDTEMGVETIIELVYKNGAWSERTKVLTDMTLWLGPGLDHIPVKRAVLDSNGNILEEFILFTVTTPAAGYGNCPNLDYCANPGGSLSACSGSGSCTGSFLTCPDGHDVVVDGTCQSRNIVDQDDPNPSCSFFACVCQARSGLDPCASHRTTPLPPAQNPWQPYFPTPGATAIFLAPCGANTPLGQDGSCQGESQPCPNCDAPLNNGGPITGAE